MNIWFTADWHLGHAKIMEYCRRPFASVEEMNQMILDNYHTLVKKHDTVYFLGDLALSARVAEEVLRKLPGKIHFIRGNHDQSARVLKEYCISVNDLKTISVAGQSIVLCHYAMRVWDMSHDNAWQLFAHTHGRLAPVGKQHDVGVDNNAFRPLAFEELTAIMASRGDNLDFLGG
jgi:calcineurin-like phosphoesterase family protein